jgi:hypothetical protein
MINILTALENIHLILRLVDFDNLRPFHKPDHTNAFFQRELKNCNFLPKPNKTTTFIFSPSYSGKFKISIPKVCVFLFLLEFLYSISKYYHLRHVYFAKKFMIN